MTDDAPGKQDKGGPRRGEDDDLIRECTSPISDEGHEDSNRRDGKVRDRIGRGKDPCDGVPATAAPVPAPGIGYRPVEERSAPEGSPGFLYRSP